MMNNLHSTNVNLTVWG